MDIIYTFIIGVVGAIFGSFACCQAWRLRYRQKGKKDPGKWSVCLSCKKRIAWYDNIPIISWLVLRGKCRRCGKPIGAMEFLSEVGMAAIFSLVYWHFREALWAGNGQAIGQCVVLLIMLVPLWILLLYDGKWGEMPEKLLYFCIACGVAYAAIGGFQDWLSIVGSVAILSGTYLLLYVASREKLVGGGDWLLCLSLALGLGDWWLALLTLFIANLLGTIVMAPLAMKTKKRQVHLAPFLIAGFLIVFLMQDFFQSLLIIG